MYEQSRATTPGTEEAPAPTSLPLASQGRQRSRSDLTPVREGLVLGRLSRENSSLESMRSGQGGGRTSGAATPAMEVKDLTPRCR